LLSTPQRPYNGSGPLGPEVPNSPQETPLPEAAHSSRQASQSRRLFELGKLTLDQALTAEIAASQAQEALVRARLAEGENLLRLYQALGGGWQD